MKCNLLVGRRNLLSGKMNKFKKAQVSLEYAIVIAVFVAALISMKVYLKRGIQGNFRKVADGIGSPYEPKNTTSDKTNRAISTGTASIITKEDTDKNKIITTTTSTNTDTSKTDGWEQVGPIP